MRTRVGVVLIATAVARGGVVGVRDSGSRYRDRARDRDRYREELTVGPYKSTDKTHARRQNGISDS